MLQFSLVNIHGLFWQHLDPGQGQQAGGITGVGDGAQDWILSPYWDGDRSLVEAMAEF